MKTYIYGIAYYSDGKIKNSRNFVDYKAFSRWANAQYRKDNEVLIEEYRYNNIEYNIDKFAIWHE